MSYVPLLAHCSIDDDTLSLDPIIYCKIFVLNSMCTHACLMCHRVSNGTTTSHEIENTYSKTSAHNIVGMCGAMGICSMTGACDVTSMCSMTSTRDMRPKQEWSPITWHGTWTPCRRRWEVQQAHEVQPTCQTWHTCVGRQSLTIFWVCMTWWGTMTLCKRWKA